MSAEPEPQDSGEDSSEPAVLLVRAGDALLRPVRAGNAFEETVERLLTAIRMGVVQPGHRLPAERALAPRLNVSRVTLREAIRSLEAAGYVEVRRGRYGGTFVTGRLPRSRRPALVRRLGKRRAVDVEDALALREALELGGAELAARRRLTAEDQAHLRHCLAECEAATGIDNYRRADSRLHLAIAELTGAPSLVAAVADARMRVNALLDAIPELGPNVAHSNAQHAQILAAILERDPERARRAMAEHVAGTGALLRGFLGERFPG